MGCSQSAEKTTPQTETTVVPAENVAAPVATEETKEVTTAATPKAEDAAPAEDAPAVVGNKTSGRDGVVVF